VTERSEGVPQGARMTERSEGVPEGARMTRPGLPARYLADSVATASPARLLVMLYDRLVLDLDRGHAALAGGDPAAARPHLLNAQEIVAELHATLEPDAWAGGPGLSALYAYLLGTLITANLAADPARVSACRDLVTPLRDAWREAAQQYGAQAGRDRGAPTVRAA